MWLNRTSPALQKQPRERGWTTQYLSLTASILHTPITVIREQNPPYLCFSRVAGDGNVPVTPSLSASATAVARWSSQEFVLWVRRITGQTTGFQRTSVLSTPGTAIKWMWALAGGTADDQLVNVSVFRATSEGPAGDCLSEWLLPAGGLPTI